jgi:hypothetical protein
MFSGISRHSPGFELETMVASETAWNPRNLLLLHKPRLAPGSPNGLSGLFCLLFFFWRYPASYFDTYR